MEYTIQGGKPLSGEIGLSGAKNVALKLIIAALLCEGKTRINNVPRIRDVEALIEIVNVLGGSAHFIEENTVEVENTLTKHELPLEYAAHTRVSFMLIVPLLYTFGRALIPNPGGCRIGARPVDRLIEGLKSFGCAVSYSSEDGLYHAQFDNVEPATFTFEKRTHTGTELMLMAAARINGESTIENASLEPEIDDLIAFFNKAGARVKRDKEQIIVAGKKTLTSPGEFSIQYDRNEAVSYIVLSALFGGAIVVRHVDISVLEPFLSALKHAGIDYEYDAQSRRFAVKKPTIIRPTHIVTRPHPGFMTDWQPMWALLMTQAEGMSTIHETVFENRFSYVEELKKFGASMAFYSPVVQDPENLYQFNWDEENANHQNAIRISGPTPLHNAIAHMSDLRAGACLVMAALTAEGKSIISGAEQIERGYEHLAEKLRGLEADVVVGDE